MPSSQKSKPTPPRAKKDPILLLNHKDVRVDPYFWMNQRDSKEVLEHIDSENKYTNQVLSSAKSLEQKVLKELRSRIKSEDESCPYKKGSYFYFSRYEEGGDYPIYYRYGLKSSKDDAHIILNVPLQAKGKTYYQIGSMSISPNEKILAYSFDDVGRRIYEIRFRDLTTGKELKQRISKTTGNFVWAENGRQIIYTKQDTETLRWDEVRCFDLKTTKNTLIYKEKNNIFSVSVSKSTSRKFIFLNIESTDTSELRYLASDYNSKPPKAFSLRKNKIKYSVEHAEGQFFILTNSRAKNFRLAQCGEGKTQMKHWKPLIPHRKDVLLEDFLILKNWVTLEVRTKGLTQLEVYKKTKSTLKKEPSIKLPDKAYWIGLDINPEYESNLIRYCYESPVQSPSIYNYDPELKKSTLLKKEEVPHYKQDLYEADRIFAKSRDGQKIPITLVYKKDLKRQLKKTGENPLFVYGYGSYGLSLDPWFDSDIVSLLDRGFVYATIHVRGGSEMGRDWYDSGRMAKKKNTFNDFIDATEFLVKKKYGDPKRVYAMGASAGGLLMGAIVNMRPDLYRGVVAGVPFVDALTTMLDESIPLTTGEYEQWGNPNEKKFYEIIKSYSPYDNVKPLKYPHILAVTGYHDSQVQYWEPMKWICKIRDFNQGESLQLFKVDLTAGHSGASGRYESLKDTAFEYAFILWLDSK